MATSNSTKRLRVRRPGECVVCRRDLSVGDEAVWDWGSRTLTCLLCTAAPGPVSAEQPRVSALREYDRRTAARERHAQEMLGGLGALLSRLIDEPASTRAWRQGGRGEVRTGQRLSKHLRDHPIRLLHDRRVPGHGRANIDHMAIGPAGVLVIDTKTHKGKISTSRIGGLFAPRRTVLLINGREQTHLIDGVERQVGYVRATVGDHSIEVRGVLCFPDPDGLPMFSQLSVRDIVIDGPKPIATLARRPGPMDADEIDQVWRRLGQAFPPA